MSDEREFAATPAQAYADATETLPDMTEEELKAFDCTNFGAVTTQSGTVWDLDTQMVNVLTHLAAWHQLDLFGDTAALKALAYRMVDRLAAEALGTSWSFRDDLPDGHYRPNGSPRRDDSAPVRTTTT